VVLAASGGGSVTNRMRRSAFALIPQLSRIRWCHLRIGAKNIASLVVPPAALAKPPPA